MIELLIPVDPEVIGHDYQVAGLTWVNRHCNLGLGPGIAILIDFDIVYGRRRQGVGRFPQQGSGAVNRVTCAVTIEGRLEMLVNYFCCSARFLKRIGLAAFAVCELASGTDGDSRALMTTKSAARATIDMALISYKIFNWVEILGPTLWSCCAADCSTKITGLSIQFCNTVINTSDSCR